MVGRGDVIGPLLRLKLADLMESIEVGGIRFFFSGTVAGEFGVDFE